MDEMSHETILVFYRRNDGSVTTIDYDCADAYERRLALIDLRDADRIVWVATREEVLAANRWTWAVKIKEAANAAKNAARFPEPPSSPAPEFTISGPTVEVSLPHRFYDDHVARECNPGRLVRRNRTSVRVLLDGAAWDDLMSDASYYADDATSSCDPSLRGLGSSAAATVRRLRAAGRPG